MQIEDISVRDDRDVIVANPDDTVANAVKALAENNIGALPICDSAGQLVGIISERDIVRELSSRGTGILEEKLHDLMTKEVFTCKPEDGSNDVMTIMQTNRFRHIPSGKPIVKSDNLRAHARPG